MAPGCVDSQKTECNYVGNGEACGCTCKASYQRNLVIQKNSDTISRILEQNGISQASDIVGRGGGGYHSGLEPTYYLSSVLYWSSL